MRNHTRNHSIGGLLVATVLVIAGCSDSPPDAILSPGSAEPGTATVSVTANPAGAAALSFAITGGGIDDVRASGDGLLYWETVSGTTRVVAVFPGPASGALFTIHVPDTRVVSRYVVRLEEAADTYNDVSDAGAVSVQLN
jgi:hypothetical protein